MNDFKTYTISAEEKQGLISAIKTELEARAEVSFAYIFGSFVDPEMPFFRDIDIGVYLDEKAVAPSQFLDYSMKLGLELEALLRKCPVDVVVLNNAPCHLAFRVIQNELLFTRDENLWADFVVYISVKHNDIAPLFNHYFEEAYIEK